jgi:alanyl-tRNA synthetase
MTERLYYNDSFMREFDARVISCDPDGTRWRVVLDQTAFYPTSGGQPFDVGRLGDADVVEVMDDETSGDIVHFTSQQVISGTAHGGIDWQRRFDHMQQHTAQHMLSAAFVELFKFQTVSFHLGREISTIDLSASSVAQSHLDEAERRVNEIIFEDRPITVRYSTAEELSAGGIRKKVEREGVLRVVDIDSFDRQPCGGTHLARTGQAGMLLIRKGEKQKQNWRLEFVAGLRALSAAKADLMTVQRAAEAIGCGMAEVPDMVRKIQDDRRAHHRESKKIVERLAELEAAETLATRAEISADGKRRVIAVISEDASPAYIALLAARLCAGTNVQAVLAGRATRSIVFAQSADLTGDMGALLRELIACAGGKGGGSKNFSQGSLPDASALDAIVKAARDRLLDRR